MDNPLQAGGAARGGATLSPQPRSGLNCYAVLKGGDAIPRAALRLQGVIHIGRHTASFFAGLRRTAVRLYKTPFGVRQ
jgi:hypothetical protein